MSAEHVDPAALRIDYPDEGLLEDDLAPTWPEQFARWFDDAVTAELPEPNAVLLATAGADGLPDARLVLMKAWDADGVVVFTNSESTKGRQLAENPYAALVFPWHPMHRQVRMRGPVEIVAAAVSDAYFATRPWGSRIAARVSHQSSAIPDRVVLQADFDAQALAHPQDTDPPRPPGWVGYRVRPVEVEFWSGRRNRLHDRHRFTSTTSGAQWVRQRLAP